MLPQLLFPAEDARFVAGFFSFGNHAFALEGARNSGPGEDILRVEGEDAPRGFNGAVKILLGVIGLRQAMQRVAKLGMEFERTRVFRNGFRQFAFAEEIDSRVVMVFRGLIGRVAHARILASPWTTPFAAPLVGARAFTVTHAGHTNEERSLAALPSCVRAGGMTMLVRRRACPDVGFWRC